MAASYLIVGLGNIGPEYALTRHNMGFMTLDAFAMASNVVFSTMRYGDMAEVRLKGNTLHLLKPSTYMNLSGKAVAYWYKQLKIAPENLLVVVDDLALPFGTMRLRKAGSDGGHNGLKSIDYHLITNQYARLRLGIGNGFAPGGQVDFVLHELLLEEKRMLPEVLNNAIEAIKCFVLEGPDKAMTRFNRKSTPPAADQSKSSEENSSSKAE
ncbi:MAG: aminoacyl-tRNA hydrolase [Bacteroidales bacterium]|nr:aminoacyl-tRNA hydrolase [Bacteroidales bacterium]